MNDDWKVTGVIFGLVALMFLCVAGTRWYTSWLQQQVYERQGVKMTHWECFMGAKPVERYIKEKEDK